MSAWASPRDERHMAYVAFARRLQVLAADEAEEAFNMSPGAAH
jgi:hypothetical protein